MNKDQKEFRKLAREAVKLYRNKKWGASIAKWDEIILLLQDDLIKARAYVRRGNAKDDMGDYKGAIADYDRAIKINPQYAKAYNNRGCAKDDTGDLRGAIADYDRAIEINPQYAKAYYNRGCAKSDMGDHEGAIADYDQAIKINPQYAKAYNNRGNAKSNMGDYEGAIADYNRALRINPESVKASRNFNLVLGHVQGSSASKSAEPKKQPSSGQGASITINTLGGGDGVNEKQGASAKDKEEFRRKETSIKRWMWALGGVSILLFGGILGWGVWLMTCSLKVVGKPFNSYFLLPFAVISTAMLYPLFWIISMLKDDKEKIWGKMATDTVLRANKEIAMLRSESKDSDST